MKSFLPPDRPLLVVPGDDGVVTRIGRALRARGGGPLRFGRNEMGNQHLHRTVDRLLGDRRS
jgi:hypothetical protein